MIIDNPMNKGVIGYLRVKMPGNPLLAPPDSVADPYMGHGSHPDIVQHVWDGLGAALPSKCRCLVYGTPAIVHDLSGIVIAICNGTQYNLRMTANDFHDAIAKGASTRTRWSNGEEMDSLEVLGDNWIFGGWFKEERQWCLNSYNYWSKS